MNKKLLISAIAFLWVISLFPSSLFAQTYCDAQGDDCGFGYISNVKLKTINKTTACTFYGDYTGTDMVV